MSIIKVQNINTSGVPKTFLSVNQASGVGTVYIKNPNGFQANWAIQIGETGEELSEVVLANSSTPTGTSIVLTGTTLYDHAADTPLYAIKYDKAVFAKSVTGTSSAATQISNGTVTLTPDTWDTQEKISFTQFDDTSGAATDAYRSYFFNSVTSGSTSFSDWLTSGGYSFYSLAKLTQRIREKLWNSNYIQTDDPIHNWINEWKDNLANSVISVNEGYSMGSTQISFGTAGLGTVTDATFTNPRRLWVTYDGVGYAESQRAEINNFYPGQTFLTSAPRHAFISNNVIQVNPAQTGGTISMIYYLFGTTMVNDTDELPQPMRSFTDSFIDYGVAQAALVDNKLDIYDRKEAATKTAKFDFVQKITNRDKSNETYITRRDALSGEDGFWPV